MPRGALPIPSEPVRAVAYVRVSMMRDTTGISPDLQMRAIEDHCRQRGYLIMETLQDLDLSGRFWNRRQVNRAVTMIEDGRADVIVVWRWSRVTRNRLDWAVAVDRVETAGGRLESATEAFDTSTSTGRLARGVLAEMAAFESDRVGDVWREIRERRVALGLPSNGAEMLGYRKRADGQYVPDRRTGPILAELYRRSIRGTSFTELARWLEAHRIKPPGGRMGTWTGQGVARTLDYGFAAGYMIHQGKHVPGAQTPLITADVWDAYRAHRDATRNQPRRTPQDFLGDGLVWCTCGGRMTAVHTVAPGYCRYQCRTHQVGRPGASIIRDRLDALLHTWVIAVATDDTVTPAVDAGHRQWIQQLDERAADLRAELAAGRLDADRQAEVVLQLEEVRAQAAGPPPSAYAAALLEDWAVLDIRTRRRRLAAFVARIEVTNIRPTPLLNITTTSGTVLTWTGVQAERLGHPSTAGLPTPGASEPATTTDVLQLLTPSEAARIAGVAVNTVRSWDTAGHLPHTQIAPDGFSRRYAIGDLRTMRHRYKVTGVWVAVSSPPSERTNRPWPNG